MQKQMVQIKAVVWLILVLSMVPVAGIAQEISLFSFGDIQQSVLNRRLRLGVITGAHIVDSPCCDATDWAIGGAVHLLLYRSSATETYLVGEGVFSKSRHSVNVQIDDETIEMPAPITRHWGLNLHVTGLNWISHNPWHIFPYAVAGIGLLDRPARNRTVDIPDIYERPVSHDVSVVDCGSDAFCVNVGLGLQFYYVLRLDFRVSLPERSGMALYRAGVEILF